MKILFVYPQYPYTFWSFKHAPEIRLQEGRIPPTGLTGGGSDATGKLGEKTGGYECYQIS